MISYTEVKKRCPICGTESLQKVQTRDTKSNSFYLDGCPVGDAHESLLYSAESCPNCEFAAYDLNQNTKITEEYLSSEKYKGLVNPRIDENTSKYARLGLISISLENYFEAVNEFLKAAWCSDYHYDTEMSSIFRKRSLDILTRYKNAESFPPEMQVRVLDIFRRIGDFKSCQKLADIYLENTDENNKAPIKYENALASYGIKSAKTFADVNYYVNILAQSGQSEQNYTIDNKTYSDIVEGHGKGWHWNPELRILSLMGYHGGSISITGSVTIILDGVENSIRDEHSACISVSGGDLYIYSNNSRLNLHGDKCGIYANDGKVIIESSKIEIEGKKYGINADNDVVIIDSDVNGTSNGIFIKSKSGGLFVRHGYIMGSGNKAGIDVNNDTAVFLSIIKIESPNGTAFHIHNGSYSLSMCMQTILGSDYGLRMDNGDLLNGVGSNLNISGGTALFVNNNIHLSSSTLSAIGKERGINVNGDIAVNNIDFSVSGDIGIYALGDLVSTGTFRINVNGVLTGIIVEKNIFFNGGRVDSVGKSNSGIVCSKITAEHTSVTAIGSDTGVHVKNCIELRYGKFEVSGETAVKICGDAVFEKESIFASGAVTGIEIAGTLIFTGGEIISSGKISTGLRVLGEKAVLTSGAVDVSGKEYGVFVKGDLSICLNFTSSGKIGCHTGGSINIQRGVVNISGEEIGLNVSGGSMVLNDSCLVEASGDIGVYLSEGFVGNGGMFQACGQFCGFLIEKKDALFNDGCVEITGDEYGMLVQKGSVFVKSAEVSITSESSGLCIDDGDLILESDGDVSVSGDVFGVTANSGNIVLGSQLKSSGRRYAVSTKNLKMKNGVLTANASDANGAAFIGNIMKTEEEDIILCGLRSENARAEEYINQNYLHIYPKQSFRLKVSAAVENLEYVFKWLEMSLRSFGVGSTVGSQLMLVAEELFVNVTYYAYPDKSGDVNFILYADDELKLVISDNGIPFDPLSFASPDASVPIDERKLGGWGIYLSRKLTDKITYKRIEDRNVLTVYKNRYR